MSLWRRGGEVVRSSRISCHCRSSRPGLVVAFLFYTSNFSLCCLSLCINDPVPAVDIHSPQGKWPKYSRLLHATETGISSGPGEP